MSEKTTMQEIEDLLHEMLVQRAVRLDRRRRASSRRARAASVDAMLRDLIAELEQRIAGGGAHE
ncbi:hypothetical protein ACNRBH_09145 [Ralstonia pseudosolanacearum]|uniref:hypothetical protein n=1 Tax=Ralstonia pseudosolanacearum TaxID=1310165 RepID=UPI0026766579|nr:hypothetical protein [Ralstonia pseudosolanacearum]MDO3527526.1 hypothetical protein [Ralstonia pseudosolanacearum]MDO3531605.1 hypothetical protein [Ralstonia pseudosolanacearum]